MLTKAGIRRRFIRNYGQTPEFFMDIAATEMVNAVDKGYYPFTALTIGLGGNILHSDHDRVSDIGPWAHAEFNNIAALCRRDKPKLPPHSAVVTSSEPCPFCFNLLQKAKVETIVFGARTESTANWPKPMEEAIIESNFKPYLIADVNGEFMTRERTKLLSRLSQV